MEQQTVTMKVNNAGPEEIIRNIEEQLGFQANFDSAAALARSGRYTEAEEELKLFDGWEKSAPALDLMARICAQQGKLARAGLYWEQALKISPTNLDYQNAYNEVSRRQRPVSGLYRWLKALGQVALLVLGIVLVGYIVLLLAQPKNTPAPAAPAPVVTINVTQIAAPPNAPVILPTDITNSLAGISTGQAHLSAQIDGINQQIQQNVPTPKPDLALNINLPGVTTTKMDRDTIITFDSPLFMYGWVFNKSSKTLVTQLGNQLAPQAKQIHIILVGWKVTGEPTDYFDPGLSRAVIVYDLLTQSTNLPASIFEIMPQAGFVVSPYASGLKSMPNQQTVIMIVEPAP